MKFKFYEYPNAEVILRLRDNWNTKFGEKSFNPFFSISDFVVTAEDSNGIIAGASMVQIDDKSVYTEQVTSMIKNKGIATKMLQFRNEKLKELGFKSIFSECLNENGKKLAKKLGAIPTGIISHIGIEMEIKLD